MSKPSLAVVFVAVLAAGSCDRKSWNPNPVGPPVPTGVLAHLVTSERLELIALHPSPRDFTSLDGLELFHGYPVLGRAELTELRDRDAVLFMIEGGIEDSDGRVADCFKPRHGLSITKNGVTTDLVICFECHQIEVFEDGVEVPGHLTSARFAMHVTHSYTSHGLTVHGTE